MLREACRSHRIRIFAYIEILAGLNRLIDRPAKSKTLIRLLMHFSLCHTVCVSSF